MRGRSLDESGKTHETQRSLGCERARNVGRVRFRTPAPRACIACELRRVKPLSFVRVPVLPSTMSRAPVCSPGRSQARPWGAKQP